MNNMIFWLTNGENDDIMKFYSNFPQLAVQKRATKKSIVWLTGGLIEFQELQHFVIFLSAFTAFAFWINEVNN